MWWVDESILAIERARSFFGGDVVSRAYQSSRRTGPGVACVDLFRSSPLP